MKMKIHISTFYNRKKILKKKFFTESDNVDNDVYKKQYKYNLPFSECSKELLEKNLSV